MVKIPGEKHMISLTPLFLTSSGRSGTTMMMKILSAHPDILARTIFPYETRMIQYAYLCEKNGNKVFDGESISLKQTEYKPFQGDDYLARHWAKRQLNMPLGENGKSLAKAYYQVTLEEENKSNPVYVAEKTIGLELVTELIKSFEDARVIALFRDPRDIFCSIKSFNARRGFLSFGEEHGDELMFEFTVNFLKRLKSFSEVNPCIFRVNYEDLIYKPAESVVQLFSKLNLRADIPIIENVINSAFHENTNQIKRHKTSGINAKNSVDRWRNIEDERTIEMFDRFQDDIKKLGYDY